MRTPPPVQVLGIDETRRGTGKYEIEASTGVKLWVGRFDAGLVDLDGTACSRRSTAAPRRR